jgi:di/tricarboxylate transporter
MLDAALMLTLAAGLIWGRFGAARIFGLFILAVICTGRIPFDDSMARLTSPAIIAVASLVIASAALAKIPGIGRTLFGRGIKGPRLTLARLLGAASLASAVTPNTAVVGALMGAAVRKPGMPPYRLLLPLSYMALAGGMLTPFGTAASLMVVGEATRRGIDLSVIDFLGPGLFVVAAVYVILVLVSPILLTRHQETANQEAEVFYVEARIETGSALIGKSISQNRLRHLDSFFLAEIVRDDTIIKPVHPSNHLQDGDRLIFVGDITHIDELREIAGLTIVVAPQPNTLGTHYRAVISYSSMLIGKTLRQIDFRARFDASVMAVRRGEEGLSGKLGDIRLRTGDVLVLAAGPDFGSRDNIRNNLHILDADDQNSRTLSTRASWMLGGAFSLFLVAALFQLIPFALAAFLLACTLIAMQWVTPREAKRIFPFDIVIILWGAILLSVLIQTSGMSDAIAAAIAQLTTGLPPIAALAAIFFLAWVMTELFSNASAALTAFPVALETALRLDLPPEAFILATAFGASASFLMPFGYQTHLMVMTPGQYRLVDFLRLGGVVFIAYSTAALGAIAWIHL